MDEISSLKSLVELFGPSGLTIGVLYRVGRLYVKAQEDRIADLKAQMDVVEELLRQCLGDRGTYDAQD